MCWRHILIPAGLLAAVAVAVVAYGQFVDTETASGEIAATSTSADLYICEPDGTPPPDCGSDDNGADEAIFETLEDIRPGEIVSWDIRLQNVGSDSWTVLGVTLTVTEVADPGDDCPDDAIVPAPVIYAAVPYYSDSGVFILSGPCTVPGAPVFLREAYPDQYKAICTGASASADVRLRLQLSPVGTEYCDGNIWNVSWVWTVG